MRYWILLGLFVLYLQPLGVTVSADAPGAAPVSHGSREATLSGALQRGRDAVSRGDHAAAVAEYRRAAKLATEMDAHGRADIYYRLGNAHRRLNQQEDAVTAYTDGLAIPGVSDPVLKSRLLNARGISYRRLARYEQAVASLAAAVALREGLADGRSLATAQANLGAVYQLQGRYAQAIAAFRGALSSLGKSDQPETGLRVALRTDIGLVLSELGDFDSALQEFQTALQLLGSSPDAKRQGRLLHNMAFAYFRRGDVDRSVEVYTQALALRRQAGDRRGEGKTLNNLGFAQGKLGRHEQALKTLQDAVAIARERGDQATEGRTLDSIATVYMHSGRQRQALEHLYTALAIKRAVGDRGGEHVTLANMGRVHLAEERLALAILFLKASVNVTEAIRNDLGTLPRKTRQAYTDTVAENYRLLADLLLRQDRILEAERVLDLLRLEELDEYLGGVRGSGDALSLSPAEEAVLVAHQRLVSRGISLGRELTGLKEIAPTERTAEQKRRIRELRRERALLKKAFQDFQDTPEVVAAFKEQSAEEWEQSVQLAQLMKLSAQLDRDAALLYPLILPDRLELILATTHAPPVHLPQPVSEQTLKATIFALRQALANRSDAAVGLANKLYAWLFEPLEQALAAGDISTIVYVPDGQLRYVPLAALHDGNDWLIRRFRINLITALSLTDFARPPSEITNVLAGAFTVDRVAVELPDAQLHFQGLPFARREVEELEDLYPGAVRFVDDDFTLENLVPQFEDYQVVHLATHGLFRPGRPAHESFILFADSKQATLPVIENTWLLSGVDLMVLSACETGVGGVLGNGEEIHGFGYLMQNAGANAVLASLWKVSDGGTQALMSAFYRHLNKPGTSKSEALRQAQLELLGNSAAEGGSQAERGVQPAGEEPAAPGFGHPYFWAPFVLIGNGL